jgi:hypothetical protein
MEWEKWWVVGPEKARTGLPTWEEGYDWKMPGVEAGRELPEHSDAAKRFKNAEQDLTTL